MERKTAFVEGEYYHVYNRGVEKRNIFTRRDDYERFLKLLYVANNTESFVFREIQDKPISQIERSNTLVAIGTYCLMPNHFHILVKEIMNGGISIFMEKLTTGYAKYFNTKYERVGTLFQGRFKADLVERDEHLQYLFAYIHLNPLKLIDPLWKKHTTFNKDKKKHYLEKYRYSSYPDYTGENRDEIMILSKDVFPEYFLDIKDFNDFIKDLINSDT